MVNGDIDGGPIRQIRDDSWPIATPSLQQAGWDVAPEEMVRDLLDAEWSATEAGPKPRIIAKDDAIQVQLAQKTPSITVEVEDWREEPNGHRHEFVDIEVPVSLYIQSWQSRGHMYNMVAECRRIVYRWMLAMQPFQCLYWDSFRPDYAGPGNFSGIARLRLTSDAVPIFLRRVAGEESPNTDPSLFPRGIDNTGI